MGILQKLYENGFITYHRTDSTNISTQIQDEIKKYIILKNIRKNIHMPEYINQKLNVHKKLMRQ